MPIGKAEDKHVRSIKPLVLNDSDYVMLLVLDLLLPLMCLMRKNIKSASNRCLSSHKLRA